MGADFFDWRADGSLIWTVGNYLQTLPDTAAPVPTGHVELVAALPRAVPRSRLLLRGGRALTMAGGARIIAGAAILNEGDRIAAIGPHGSQPMIAAPPSRRPRRRAVTPRSPT